jgi:hypothetical protein
MNVFENDKYNKFGDKIYSGAATIGKIQAYITFFVSIIGVGLLIWYSYTMIRTNQDHLVDADGKVLKSECDSRTEKYGKRNRSTRTVYDCDIDVEFKIGNTTHSGPLSTTGGSNITVNQPYDVTYDKNDPTKFTAKTMRSKKIGYITFAVAIIILIISVGYFSTTILFKPMAALRGVDTVTDIVF